MSEVSTIYAHLRSIDSSLPATPGVSFDLALAKARALVDAHLMFVRYNRLSPLSQANINNAVMAQLRLWTRAGYLAESNKPISNERVIKSDKFAGTTITYESDSGSENPELYRDDLCPEALIFLQLLGSVSQPNVY